MKHFFLSFALFLVGVGLIANALLTMNLPFQIPFVDNFGQGEAGIGGGPEPQPLPEGRHAVSEVVEHALPSVATIALTADIGRSEVEGNIGSGFVISSDGYIATNKHVVSLPDGDYSVIVNNDKEYKVEKIYQSPTTDLAILKVKATGLKPLPLGDSSRVRLGENVVAIGTTLGQFSNSVTQGIVSGLDREIEAGSFFDTDTVQLEKLIQTDAAINFGSSGGPLLNERSEVIGINTAVAGGAQNVGFAIPVNTLKEFINTIP